MICEKLLGKVQDSEFAGKNVDYVDFEWDEAFKRLHRKKSRGGVDVGINLDDSILTRGLNQGDVLAIEGDSALVVNILECEAIKVVIDKADPAVIAKFCYEIGNRHAPLFRGENTSTFLTPYNGPMLTMIERIPGLTAKVEVAKFDFDTRISATVHSHTH